MDIDQEFEKWYKSDCPVDGIGAKLAAKAAWRAARGSIVIELPDHFDKYESGDFMYWAEDVEKAIRAAGASTK